MRFFLAEYYLMQYNHLEGGKKKMGLQENLRALRERAGYSQAKDFAENILKIPYSTYMGYETRGTWPTEENLCKIAAALHVTTDELLGYELDEYGQMKKFLFGVGLVLRAETEGEGVIIEEAFSTPTRKWRYDSIDTLQKAVQAVNNDFKANTKALLKSALKEKFYDDSKEVTPCLHTKK